MSATEVTSQFGIVSRTCRAIAGSKIVTSSGTSGVEVADEQRHPQRERVLARGHADDVEASSRRASRTRLVVGVARASVTSAPPASSASQTSSARSPPPTSSTRRESATRGTLLRSAQQDFEPYAVQAISMSL